MAKKKKGSKKPNVAAAGAVESMPTIEDLAKEAKKGQASVIRKLNNFITTHPDQALDAIREVLSEAKNAPKNKETPKEEPVPTPTASVDAAAAKKNEQILADIKSGKVSVIPTEQLSSLQASQAKFETKEASDIVDSHIARGAIKADQKDAWVTQLTSVEGDSRKSMESMLTNLPDNKAMDTKKGDDNKLTVLWRRLGGRL